MLVLGIITFKTKIKVNIMNQKLKFAKTKNVKSPNRGTEQSAGIDFYVPFDFKETKVKPNESILIPSGIKVNVPTGHALIAFNKSGVAVKKNLVMGACVVDEDYQGEVHMHLINIGNETTLVSPGDKLAQFLLMPVNYATTFEVNENELYQTPSERGEGAFGSTGTTA
jgi:dUTP pyrophosphatase